MRRERRFDWLGNRLDEHGHVLAYAFGGLFIAGIPAGIINLCAEGITGGDGNVAAVYIVGVIGAFNWCDSWICKRRLNG